MANSSDGLGSFFLLRDDVTFLNHGSFGACPRPVFEAYQRWQRELELQPVEFFQRRGRKLLDESRAALADYIGADADDVVFVTNASLGLNIVARSIDLKPGDEVLTTNHEYGSLNKSWELVCERTGARYVKQAIPLPATDRDAVADAVWAGVTDRTRVLFVSHITSPTAMILPVEELVSRAAALGIITVIDGAHAPGQIDLDMKRIGADFYVGNCHKWMMTPKGSGFLYARREMHDALMPLVGGRAGELNGKSRLVAEHQGQGTRDLAGFLSVPESIRFMEDHDWPSVRRQCFDSLCAIRARFGGTTRLPDPVPAGREWFSQMTIVPITVEDPRGLYQRLLHDYSIEIPVIWFSDRSYLRISMQGYNTKADLDRLYNAFFQIQNGG